MNPAPSESVSSTTLRPRNRRRTHEDEDNDSLDPSSVRHHATASSSAASSRAVSPLPRARPPQPAREIADAQRSRSTSRFLAVPSLIGSQTSPSTFTSGLWGSSWSSLRGIASDLIGGDSSRTSSPGFSPAHPRKPLESAAGLNTQSPVVQWGPLITGDGELGSGTKERQRAKVEAKKRERLLIANGHVIPDGSGKYKRRTSIEREHSSLPPDNNEDRDALIYIHEVRPGDTLAGVMIKYNCQAQIFRRANRFWPNDSIQSRKMVVMPIDACGVRGRKISDSEVAENQSNDHQHAERLSIFLGSTQKHQDGLEDRPTIYTSTPTSPSLSVSLSNVNDTPYRHDSWVRIEGFEEPVEIARLSRRALGYFPRSRRKSQNFSDLDTPTTSLDLTRGSFQSDLQSPTSRTRSDSNSHFASLQGPGGVGSMSKNVRSPGPANDGLNKLFPTLEQRVAPKASFELQHHTSMGHSNGLDNLGGSIEGWVRRLANKASSSLQSPMQAGRASDGDLIELSEDAFDLGQSGRYENTAQRARSPAYAMDVEDPASAQDEMMQESFLPRGRVFYDSSRRQS